MPESTVPPVAMNAAAVIIPVVLTLVTSSYVTVPSTVRLPLIVVAFFNVILLVLKLDIS